MAEFKLVNGDQKLTIKIGIRSWHVLDHDIFFTQGLALRRAFGMAFVKGLGKKPVDGKLKTISVWELRAVCNNAWWFFKRDEDLLSYSYSYEFETEKGRRQGGAMSGFCVRGYSGFISVRPAGYCTLELSEIAPNGKGRVVEIIDLRNKKRIETDNWGYLKIHRRKIHIDWYDELPKILNFLDDTGSEYVEIYSD